MMSALLALCLLLHVLFWLLAAATPLESCLYLVARSGITGTATGGFLLLCAYIASHW